jgi:hypothetical protein
MMWRASLDHEENTETGKREDGNEAKSKKGID